jgi:DNA invertase Pin-like site-specific DNA recombinase
MNAKITPEHLGRGAVVYIRQSTLGQVVENTESQRRQYALAESASGMGFSSVAVIDDDLGRSGSGIVARPGFQKLVTSVCSGAVGAVFCIEASRLARNGRDWHHLVDLCAVVGVLVIDPDGVYDPRLVNDRLLLGLKGTMSEYELNLLRQRGLAARDSKAQRGELRFSLPPGYSWNDVDQIEIDPDERVSETIRLMFRKFRELGSARQLFLWARDAGIKIPVVRQNAKHQKLVWQAPAYHNLVEMMQNPIYSGAYAFGRRTHRVQVVDGRPRKTIGHRKPMQAWNVLIQDNHEGYISWKEFEENRRMLTENAYMQQRASRKAARGGRALLTGLVRCGRCGRIMHVFYGMASGHAHRYQCRGDDAHVGSGQCIGIGGVRIDQTIANYIMEAVSPLAVEAALEAAQRVVREDDDVRQATRRDLEHARYEASLASRRYEAVDPAKRLVARELESRWNIALERVAELEQRLARMDEQAASRPQVDKDGLLTLAHDLASAWNAPGATMRTKQRLTRVLIQEVVIDLDDARDEVAMTVHWTGGRHTEIRVARVRTGRYPDDRHPSPVEVIRTLGAHWPDRELAVTMNRMRCKRNDGESWTTLRVRALRERLGVPPFDPAAAGPETISVAETARRLKICVGSVLRMIKAGVLPAQQLMPCAPWEVPVEALESESVKIGVQDVVARRPLKVLQYHQNKALKLPGF